MTSSLRGLVPVALASVAMLLAPVQVSAHPLGNYTVNRAVVMRVGASEIEVRYIIDMAEIPAFTELQAIDRDGDAQADPSEAGAYAASTCAAVRSAISLDVDATDLPLRVGAAPELTFPAGAGGLPTLRLVCHFAADQRGSGGERTIRIADATDDGHVGWREVTISAGRGAAVAAADVPDKSPSAELTSYPTDALQTPPDVRAGTARFRLSGQTSGEPALMSPAMPASRDTADDPLASLIGGDLSPAAFTIALLVALALGAAHALSPGHGKTLVAAYLVGSGGSMRHAATLGLTVAATHTAGVFLLGGATLLIGQFLVPERVIEWLSLGSGVVVLALGAGLVVRATHRSHGATPDAHGREHTQHHDHSHPHEVHHHLHPQRGPALPELRRWNVIALGLAGGMVPSASALIVLLVAITTGRLIVGMLLIVAFGAGMAIVLAGLAVAATLLRGALRAPGGLRAHPLARAAGRAVPLIAGIAVMIAGLSATIGALTRFA